MINTNLLMLDIRMGLKDTIKSEISDYEILSSINSVLSIINSEMIFYSVDYLVKIEDIESYDEENKKFKVPDDFYRIRNLYVNGNETTRASGINNKIQYKFLNNYIYLINYTSEFIKLEYFYFIPSLNKFTDDIDLPQYFKEIIKKFSIFYLNKDTKNDSFLLSELRTTIIDNMITRESADIDREIPFR